MALLGDMVGKTSFKEYKWMKGDIHSYLSTDSSYKQCLSKKDNISSLLQWENLGFASEGKVLDNQDKEDS